MSYDPAMVNLAMLRTQTIVILAGAGLVSFVSGICFGLIFG